MSAPAVCSGAELPSAASDAAAQRLGSAPESAADRARKHRALDAGLALALAATLKAHGELGNVVPALVRWLKAFPNHYTPVFDFVSKPMSPALAVSIYATDVYFLLKTCPGAHSCHRGGK